MAAKKKSAKGVPPREMKQLLALLPLLRSGALAHLLPVASSAKPETKKTKKPKVEKGNAPSSLFQVQAEASAAGISEEAGWKVQQKPKKTVPFAGAGPTDQLLPEGWNVGILPCAGELTSESTGVVLCSSKEAQQLVTEVSAQKPLAALSPLDIDEKGQQVHVLVKDANGKTQCRKRLLFQLGPLDQPVQYMCAVPE